MAGEEIANLGEEAHEAACHAELRQLDELTARLQADESELAQAWLGAVVSARILVDPQHTEAPPTLEAIAKLEGATPSMREAGAYVCAHRERAALICWDPESLDAWGELHKKLGDGIESAQRGLRRYEAWRKLMKGEVASLEEDGKTLYSDGAGAQDASLVIDATLLRAMGALTTNDLEQATALSRRASRMARTEGLRAERFLASIVLARVRRRAGRPHLATRILSAIAPIAPGPWQGWLRWERVLAGGRPVPAGESEEVPPPLAKASDSPARRAAMGLVRWLSSAAAGDRNAFNDHHAELTDEVKGFVDISTEHEALHGALDPAIDVDVLPNSIRGWAGGEQDETPAGLHGIVGAPDGPADSTIACVVCRPERPPRRLLRVATALLSEEGQIAKLERTRLRRGRVDTAVAALALAGEDGLVDSTLFEKAYEFEFVSSLHAGILDVLVHRMRARLEGAGTVHRSGGRLRLEPLGILVLPDPRCVEHVEDRLLRVIARHGGVTTRQAAQELDVSVRTAQLALRRLLASGDCVLNRDGRRVQYLVEDTTFTEPTRH